jgi:hypothetical protein
MTFTRPISLSQSSSPQQERQHDPIASSLYATIEESEFATTADSSDVPGLEFHFTGAIITNGSFVVDTADSTDVNTLLSSIPSELTHENLQQQNDHNDLIFTTVISSSTTGENSVTAVQTSDQQNSSSSVSADSYSLIPCWKTEMSIFFQ